jgi:hypothetical protein
MSLSKQQAIDIIEREPVGGAGYYSAYTGGFYIALLGNWFVFSLFQGKWVKCQISTKTKDTLTPMHELLAVAEGED